MPKPTLAAGAAILTIMSFATPAAAQTVEPFVLQALPTRVVVTVAGKDEAAVRTEVREAARYVCRNAIRRGELDLYDQRWCSAASSERAMSVYHAARAQGRLAQGAPQIVLTVR